VSRWKDTAGRKAAVQTEGNERRVFNDVPVREAPFVVPHGDLVQGDRRNSHKLYLETGRLNGGCGQDCPPHKLYDTLLE
jgi:hypothetical protein